MGIVIRTSKDATLVSDEFSRLAIQPLANNGRVPIGARGSSLGGLFYSQFTDLCHYFDAYHISDIERRVVIERARDVAIADGQTGLEGYLFPMFSKPPDKPIDRR